MSEHELIELPAKLFFTSGYKHQVKYDFTVYIHELLIYGEVEYDFIHLKDGWLTIRAGFGWDGASGPTYDTKATRRGVLIHDVLYRLMRQGLLPPEVKELADRIMEFVMLKDGMWEWRAGVWFKSVSKYGDAAIDPRNKIKIRVAP